MMRFTSVSNLNIRPPRNWQIAWFDITGHSVWSSRIGVAAGSAAARQSEIIRSFIQHLSHLTAHPQPVWTSFHKNSGMKTARIHALQSCLDYSPGWAARERQRNTRPPDYRLAAGNTRTSHSVHLDRRHAARRTRGRFGTRAENAVHHCGRWAGI